MLPFLRDLGGWAFVLVPLFHGTCGHSDGNPVGVGEKLSTEFRLEPDSVQVAPAVTVRYEALGPGGTSLPAPSLEWSSSDPDVLRIVSPGEALAVDTGSAVVTALRSDARLLASAQVRPHPHEPHGLTPVIDRSFAQLQEDGWWVADTRNLHIRSGGGALGDSSGVLEKVYPAHAGQGGAFGGLFGKGFGDRDVQTFYLEFWWKMSSNFYGHSSGVNKIFYVAVDDNSNNVRDKIVVNNHVVRSGEAEIELRLQSVMEGERNLRANMGDARLERGRWHHVEVVLTMNSTGDRDGTARLWLDGKEVLSYDDIGYARPGERHRFIGLKFDPVWGGNNPADDIPHDMSYFLDHVYGSVGP